MNTGYMNQGQQPPQSSYVATDQTKVMYGQQPLQSSYVVTDQSKIMYGKTEAEMQQLNPHHSSIRPFDWLICSVFGCLCFPYTGLCAVYYAIRANVAVDWGIQQDYVLIHNSKAKKLTIISIVLGVVISIILIILLTTSSRASRRL